MAGTKTRKDFTKAVAGSVAIAACVGAPFQDTAADDSAEQEAASEQTRIAISLTAAASRGNPEAMYELAMLHIEGGIPDADYDLGVRMLKKAASKGNKDAQRMYAFMDNAFSGPGC